MHAARDPDNPGRPHNPPGHTAAASIALQCTAASHRNAHLCGLRGCCSRVSLHLAADATLAREIDLLERLKQEVRQTPRQTEIVWLRAQLRKHRAHVAEIDAILGDETEEP